MYMYKLAGYSILSLFLLKIGWVYGENHVYHKEA